MGKYCGNVSNALKDTLPVGNGKSIRNNEVGRKQIIIVSSIYKISLDKLPPATKK